MIRFFLYYFCLFMVHFILAEDNKCTTEESTPNNKRLCFFALNGPEESKRVKQSNKNLSCIEPSSGNRIQCRTNQTEADDSGTGVRLEIKEFYADVKNNESVSQAFEEMTKTRCDGLVISGHHVGYYTGDKTSQDRDAQGNRSADQVTLNLKFLENLSCLKGEEEGGSDCRKWFSNIKYVHLHGSHTSGDGVLDVEKKPSVDDLALSRMKKYKPEVWTRASARYLNREYASTVDENNSLSSRYLKMFPSAQIYSWAVAPTIDQGSPETFIEHLRLITAHTDIAGDTGSEVSDESKVLENILSMLNPSPELDPKCVKLTTWDRGGQEINSITSSNKAGEDEIRKIGCDFSNAIDSGDQNKITETLSDVLNKGALHQNLNRIFHALNDDSPLSAEIKTNMREQLKINSTFKEVLSEQAGNKKIGVVKRADALYLYKQIYLDDYQSGNLENQFTGDLLTLYEDQGGNQVGTAMKGMIAELIWKNNLGSSSASQGNIQALMGKLEGESDIHLQQHSELIRISSGLYQAGESKVEEIFEELFKEESDEFRDSQFFMKLWTDLQAQNTGDFAPVQSMYDSALKAVQEETDPSKKEKLTRKFANIVFGVGTGFSVRKEECLKDKFPLSSDQLEIADESRQDMVSIWKSFCNKT